MKQKVTSLLGNLSYEDKLYVFNKIFTFGNLDTDNLDDKLVLISLLALTTSKMRLKDPTITPLKILLSITKQINDGSAFYQFLEALSIITEDFLYESKEISSCGLNSSQEIITKIKELLNKWLPF